MRLDIAGHIIESDVNWLWLIPYELGHGEPGD